MKGGKAKGGKKKPTKKAGTTGRKPIKPKPSQ
jgi:hypothetical protein